MIVLLHITLIIIISIKATTGNLFEAIQSKSVSNKTTAFKTTHSKSQMECFMKVNLKTNPCLIVEVKEIHSFREWSCRFFSSTDYDQLLLIEDQKSTVYKNHQRRSIGNNIDKCSPSIPPTNPPTLSPILPAQATSCLDYFQEGYASDGVYSIKVGTKWRNVYCDMVRGGWTVFQKRIDGSVDFNQYWNQYVDGFGNPETDYWLGLGALHEMTFGGVEMRMIGFDYSGVEMEIRQDGFSVGDAASKFKLTSGYYTELRNSDSDVFEVINGIMFSARDSDNDSTNATHCAYMVGTGWWFDSCFPSLLPNGIFEDTTSSGIRWKNTSIKNITMALK